MCLSPLYIKNNTRHYSEYKPLYFHVPCGKCLQCQQNNRNEWFLRSLFEYRDSACTFFYTLTYANKFLPHLDGVPCFSKRHIQVFLKRLRKRLDDYGIGFRYFIVCEFGSRKHRPHYHGLFFFDKNISHLVIRHLVDASWQYGFVCAGEFGGLVNSDNAIYYVSKYVCKDVSFMNLERAQHVIEKYQSRYKRLFNYYIQRYAPEFSDLYLRSANNSLMLMRSSGIVTEDHRALAAPFITKYNSVISSFLPFHLQSLRFGYSMISSKRIDEVNETITEIRSSGTVVKFPLPRFVKRALWYDLVEDELSGKKTLWTPREEFISHFVYKSFASIDSSKRSYDSLLDSDLVDSLDYGVLSYLDSSRFNGMFEDLESLKNFLHYLHFNLDTYVLSAYSVVFRGRICSLKEFQDQSDCNVFVDNLSEFIAFQYADVATFDFGRISDCNSPLHYINYESKLDYVLFDNLPAFAPYEFILSILESIISYLRYSDFQVKVLTDERRRYVKQILNNY